MRIPSQLLESFFNALRQPNRRAGNPAPEAIVDSILAEGWAFPSQLEDLLLETDSRLHRLDIGTLATSFGISTRYICRRPRFLNAGVMLHEAFSASDAAALLIRLEETGFDTSPGRLIQSVLPALRAARYVTDSDLLVMEYERQEGRSHLVLRSDADLDDGDWETTKIKDSIGRRLEFTRAAGSAYRLEVRGPKYRARPERRSVTCEYCGYRYMRGDPESSLAHRSEHARMRRLIDPKPQAKFAKRAGLGLTGEQVDASAPQWMHSEIHQRAVRFKRDFGFDFIQWEGSDSTKNLEPASSGHLFFDHTGTLPLGTIAGACAFWKGESGWRLRWVWVCPKMRRLGILSHRWPQFLKRYGDFEIEAPLSQEMHSFVMEHGTPSQLAALHGAQHSGESG